MEVAAEASVYDDYKFVTREELERLQLNSLMGTSMLRPYMHGACIAVLASMCMYACVCMYVCMLYSRHSL